MLKDLGYLNVIRFVNLSTIPEVKFKEEKG